MYLDILSFMSPSIVDFRGFFVFPLLNLLFRLFFFLNIHIFISHREVAVMVMLVLLVFAAAAISFVVVACVIDFLLLLLLFQLLLLLV